MLEILLSKFIALAVVALVMRFAYKMLKNDTINHKVLLIINVLGAFIAPAALIATAMSGAQEGVTPYLNLLAYTCLAGIPLVFVCFLISFFYIHIMKDISKGVFVLKIPILYGFAWVGLAAMGSFFAI